MTKPASFRLPSFAPMLRRWDAEKAALEHEPYTVRHIHPRERATIARLGDRAYYTYGADPTTFRVVTVADAVVLDAAYRELAALHANIDEVARRAYRRGRPVTHDEATAAESRVYGDDPG